MSSWLLPSVGRPNTWFCNTDLGELSRACLTSSHSSPPYLHLFSKHTQLPCPSPLCAVPLPPPFPSLYLETIAQALPLPGHPRGCIHSAALWNHPKLCITIRIKLSVYKAVQVPWQQSPQLLCFHTPRGLWDTVCKHRGLRLLVSESWFHHL